MQTQEAIIESPEAQQAPEILSPSVVDQKGPEVRGRYGWVALLAVAAIAVALLVVQVIASPGPSFELDPSYTQAEQNRFNTLSEGSGSDQLDPSYTQAEQNRFNTLSEKSGSDQLDPSYTQAEQNRFNTLSE